MILEFDSLNYKLFFNYSEKSEVHTSSDHYYESEYTVYWYDGHGTVYSKNTQQRYPFRFRFSQSRSYWGNDDSFEYHAQVGCLNAKDSSIVDPAKYKDLILVEWFSQIEKKNKESGFDIPLLTKTIQYDIDFVKLGICLDKNGQRHLPNVT